MVILVVFSILGCTAGTNELVNLPNENGDIAGLWNGFWHRVIAPITFIISLFSDTISVFEVHNNGSWYIFGFLLGISMSGGSTAIVTRRR